MTRVIGLTGMIGSGKTAAAGFLLELGAAVIDADREAHDVMKSGAVGWQKVVAHFGRDILNDNGEIDRGKLGKIIFDNPDARKELNRITHPIIHKVIEDKVEHHREQGTEVVVIEAALYVAWGWPRLSDEIWVVVSSKEKSVERLALRNGYTEEQARTRIESQAQDDEDRLKHASVVIENNGELSSLQSRVKKEFKRFLSGKPPAKPRP